MLRSGRRRDGHGSPGVNVLNLILIQSQLMFQHNVKRRTTWKLRLRTSRQKNRAESRGSSDTRADTEAFGPVGDGANPRASRGRFGDGFYILPLAARARDFPFGIHGLFSAGIRAARRRVQIDGVAI